MNKSHQKVLLELVEAEELLRKNPCSEEYACRVRELKIKMRHVKPIRLGTRERDMIAKAVSWYICEHCTEFGDIEYAEWAKIATLFET